MEEEADHKGEINEVSRHMEVEIDEGMKRHEGYGNPCPSLHIVVAMPAIFRPKTAPLSYVSPHE